MPSDNNSFLASAEFDDAPGSSEWRDRLNRLYFESKRLLKIWWWLIILCVAGGIGWQAYSELNREPVYVSQSKMMVSGRFALPDNVYREELSNFFGTQISLMLSARVQQKAKERVVMLEPEISQSWVRLSVNQRPEASIFQLQAEGGEPDFTQKFLDAVMEEYQSFRREMRSETTENTLLAVTEQLFRLEEEIEMLENTVVEFQKKNNLIFLKEQDTSTGAYLARLTTQQAELKTRLLILENLQLNDIGTLATEQSDIIQAESVELLDRTRQEWTQLKAELEDYSVYLKAKHPKIVDLELEIERTANLLDILHRQTVQSLDERKEQLQRQITNLDAVIEQWETQALAISRKSAEFERLQYKLDRSRQNYQRLLDSTQAIQSNQNIEQETVGVLASASRASIRPPEVAKKMTEGAATGLFLGISIISVIAFLDARIRASEELVKHFDYPLVGVIPEEHQNPEGQIDLLHAKDKRHRFAEACRSLRSAILLHKSESNNADSHCILMTSATPNEGKSTISANLAVALSFTEKRVLLVDADMRQGGVHELFSIETGNGLSDYLRDEESIEGSIQTTEYERLDLIRNGSRVSNAGELLLTDRMDQLIEWARERYSYIVFDAPPVLAVHDTVELSNKADSMLFVVRADQTSVRQVKASMERLSSRASKIMGLIFNCAPLSGIDYYYYYRDYDGYHSSDRGQRKSRQKLT